MAAEDVLVSTQWVAEHMNDPKIKLVEVDVDTNAYGEGHIAGASGWNWTSQLQDQVRRDIITQSELEKLRCAAYAFWVLQMYGHQNLKLMDGGRKKWLDENRPTTTDMPSVSTSNYKAGSPNQE